MMSGVVKDQLLKTTLTKARGDAVPYHEYLIRVLVFVSRYILSSNSEGCIHKPCTLHLFS